MNKLILLGNVGKDPEKRYLPNGTPCVEFSLAVSTGKKNGRPTSQWYKCQCWNEKQQATILGYVKKGSKLCVMGTPKFTPYIAKDGKPMVDVCVSISDMSFAGSKNDGESVSSENNYQPDNGQSQGFNALEPSLKSDNIPF